MLGTLHVSLRPAEERDTAFLSEVYRSTRLEEMQASGWSEKEIVDFLEFQFQAQHKFYHEQWPSTDFDLILVNGVPAGRLYVDRRDDEIRVVDIALLPDYRGKGIGGDLLREILAEAHGKDQPVRIHVEHNNPAMHLYLRLGFKKVDTNGVYHLMECPPPGNAS
ncbi:GNAT family N-acetyltransferase [Sulfidibacter corallicola]|uniref:GNAT family N-acetyltransferase n=1 Tax=Sulfidibacter corallicola TaxID=2818388 RepID=A0A8A4U5R3_SULCO|nr:N-acetyltransferase [Sulfidibacter corallicola]QTD54085.1 GNAT family N-acetyltransferase [Sulfidibacter corallicola]